MAKIHTVRKQRDNSEAKNMEVTDAFSIGYNVGTFSSTFLDLTSRLKGKNVLDFTESEFGEILEESMKHYNMSTDIFERANKLNHEHLGVRFLKQYIDEFGKVQHDKCQDFAYYHKLQFKDKYE